LSGRETSGINDKLGMQGWLVGVGNAGEIVDVAGAGAFIEAFDVAAFALIKRCGDVDFEEAGAEGADAVAGGAIGGDEGSDDGDAVFFEEVSDETNAGDMRIAVFF